MNAAKPITVIHLVNALDFGGAEIILMRLSAGLQGEGFEQTVVSVKPPGRLAPGFEKAGVEVKTLGMRGAFSGIRGFLSLVKRIRDAEPDILQTWMFHSALIGEMAALLSRRRVRVLWSIHHTQLGKASTKFNTRVVHRLLALMSRRFPEKIIYCSESSQELHVSSGFEASKSELIFNGTDTDLYHADAAVNERLRAEIGVPLEAPVVGMAGRYHGQKDFPNLLRAFALVQQSIPSAHLVACGSDVCEENPELGKLRKACPYPEQIHLIGPRLDMPDVFAMFSVTALSSCEGEAFPLVLGEAMACEVPCVATDVGDSALIVGETGRIVPPRDSEALATALIELLRLPGEKREALGREARLRIETNFSLGRYVKSHADLYRGIVGGE